jgi:hypothetical protein
VTRSRSTVSRKASGENCGMRMYSAPCRNAGKKVSMAPLKTSAPACRTTLSGTMRYAAAKMSP